MLFQKDTIFQCHLHFLLVFFKKFIFMSYYKKKYSEWCPLCNKIYLKLYKNSYFHNKEKKPQRSADHQKEELNFLGSLYFIC